MNNLQQISNKQKNKYNEIINYLRQDKEYWLKNDIWNINDKVFRKLEYKTTVKNINFNFIKTERLKNEVKYYLVYSFKNKYMTLSKALNEQQYAIKYLIIYIEKFHNTKDSFNYISIEESKWRLYLINEGLKVNFKNEIYNSTYRYICNILPNFIKDFYDDRDEFEKDIWYSKNIEGAKIPASGSNNVKNNQINFTQIPLYYRKTVKRYILSRITKRSWSNCKNNLDVINYFFKYFYNNGYNDKFLKDLSRNDIEKYIFFVLNNRAGRNKTEITKYISWIRNFLEYIQIAQYDKAPKKDIAFLIFQDDIPKRERNEDVIKRAKFVPEPILKQLDTNIMDLDRPQFIPIYILLRETGWRGTDILNLKYDTCLEQIWNNKDQTYNYYLCGEITKTDIAQLRIPIRTKVAEIIQTAIDKAIKLSTEENNPKKYLFNTFEGKLKGKPLSKQNLLYTIKRLIIQKNIRDINGELYHFRLHSLRHTRAKEYVEQGLSLILIQKILGHRSLQMTAHYAYVSENILYEKWKSTEKLGLFKVNSKNNELIEINETTTTGKELIKYEYVRKNLDAVRVPFGICFKSSKLPCKQQVNHCLNCASFCTTTENLLEYEKEIEKVKLQIEISDSCGREVWAKKNKIYLSTLEKMLKKIKKHKIVHKNSNLREDQ